MSLESGILIAYLPNKFFQFEVPNRTYTGDEYQKLSYYPTHSLLSNEKSYFSIDFMKDLVETVSPASIELITNIVIDQVSVVLGYQEESLNKDYKSNYSSQEVVDLLNEKEFKIPIMFYSSSATSADSGYSSDTKSMINHYEHPKSAVLVEHSQEYTALETVTAGVMLATTVLLVIMGISNNNNLNIVTQNDLD